MGVNVVNLLTGGAGEDDTPDSVVAWLKHKIAHHIAKQALYEKALREVEALGAEKFDRVIAMVTRGVDPDAPKSVVKVGPHGPGCECATEEEQLCGKGDPTVN